MSEIHDANGIVGADIIYGGFAIWCAIHNRLGPMMLEDIIYGDMNVFSWPTVPPNYIAYLFTVPALYYAQFLVRGATMTMEMKDLKSGSECTAGIPGLLTRQCSLFVSGYPQDVSYFKEGDLTIYNISNVVMGFWINYGILGALRKLNSEEAAMFTKKKDQ